MLIIVDNDRLSHLVAAQLRTAKPTATASRHRAQQWMLNIRNQAQPIDSKRSHQLVWFVAPVPAAVFGWHCVGLYARTDASAGVASIARSAGWRRPSPEPADRRCGCSSAGPSGTASLWVASLPVDAIRQGCLQPHHRRLGRPRRRGWQPRLGHGHLRLSSLLKSAGLSSMKNRRFHRF